MQSSKDTTQKSGISSSTSTNIGGLQTSTQTHLPSLSETLGLGRKDKQQQQQQQSQQQSQQDQGPPASETGTGMGTLGVGLGLGPRGEHSAAAPASASASTSSSAQRSSQQQQQQATTSSSSSQQAQSSQQPHTVVTTTTTAPAQSKQESYPAGASSSSSSMQATQRHEQQTQQAQAQPLVYSQAEQPQVYRAETSSGAPEFAEGQGPTVVTYRQTTVATWPGEAPKPAEKVVEVVPVPLAPPGRLDGKVCVITGGTSGIGLSTARLFRDEGARVVITSKCDSQECAAQGKEDVKSKCEHEEGFDVVPTDVRVLEEIDALYRHVQREYGGIDVLFANAGIALFKDSKQVDDRFFDAIMDTNVKGTFFTVTKAMPLMNEGSTVIINSSNVSEMGWPGGSVYAASKAAVRSFARTWTLEVPPHRTRFNVLSPGAVETPLLNRMGKTQEEVKEICDIMMQKIPAKRFASPEEIARIALFMAGDESKYIVGAEICADGGWTQV